MHWKDSYQRFRNYLLFLSLVKYVNSYAEKILDFLSILVHTSCRIRKRSWWWMWRPTASDFCCLNVHWLLNGSDWKKVCSYIHLSCLLWNYCVLQLGSIRHLYDGILSDWLLCMEVRRWRQCAFCRFFIAF